MEQSQTSFNIMNLLAQSVAKIEAMDELDVKNPKLEIKVPRTARCTDTASIVYHYLRVVSPELASLLLDIHPEVDMECTFTLEEVVQEWKMTGDNKAVLHVTKYEDSAKEKVKINKDCTKGRKFVNDNSKALHTYKGKRKKISLILDDDIRNLDVEISKENQLSNKKEGKFEIKASKKTHRRRICRKSIQFFTPGEDSVILDKLNGMGDDLNIIELAKELGREKGSVRNRIKKLKSGDAGRKHKSFSLAEDEAIMEKVLPGLQNNKLHELFLHQDKSLDDLAAALGRPNKGNSFSLRWVNNLQPWIMQYYAGTLNLDIRMMLVNHLAETYQSRESIDWNAVAEKSEFAGNTVTNLQYTLSYILKSAKIAMKTECTSWNQILVCCREYISQARKSTKSKLRKIQVIQYFENYVKKQELEDFL